MGLDSFLKDFNSKSSKIDGVSMTNKAPEFFIDSGNYCLNKILTGNYLKGFGQGRLAAIAGPSASGKSFIAGNAIKAAQDANYGIFVMDSENGLDETYLTNLGVDVDNPLFMYRGIKSITQAVDLFSNFGKAIRSNAVNERFLIVIDSLDMLMTDSEIAKYDKKNTIGGDQGQQVKQLKKMLQTMVQDVKDLPAAVLCTKQVYKNQDPIMQKQEPYIFADALKFAFSQILTITRLLLKNDETKAFDGINLKAFGYKTRFTKPYQQIKIEVPYEEGMDRFSGILDAAVHLGIVEKGGAWYTFGDTKFQKKTFDNVKDSILQSMIENDSRLEVEIEDEEYNSTGESRKKTLEEKIKNLAKDD